MIVSYCFPIGFYFWSSTVPEYFWFFSIGSLILDLLPTVDTGLMDTCLSQGLMLLPDVAMMMVFYLVAVMDCSYNWNYVSYSRSFLSQELAVKPGFACVFAFYLINIFS